MSLVPQPGSYVQILYGAGSESTYANEAMSEVNLYTARWGFKARYTVYRITTAARRILTDTATPIFQKQVHGAGDWVALTPSEIWYGAGYIVLSAALNNDDLVRCSSGKYLTPTTLIGCVERNLTLSRKQEDVTCYGDTAVMRAGSITDWNASLTALYAKKCAEISSAGGAADSHIRVIHELGGVAGNGTTIDLQDNDAASLTVSVVATDIVVDLDTNAGSPISTASEVCAALNASAAVKALHLRAELVDGENGTGVVADSGPYTLAGGLDQIDFDALVDETVAFRFYSVYSAGDMQVGFGKIESIDWQGGPSDMLKAGLSVVGAKYQMHHVIE